MLKTRVVPTLLYKDFGLVKGVRFDPSRAIGNAMQAVKVYNLRDVDELVFFDVSATLDGRTPDLALIDELADECFMPLTVGGGVRTLQDVAALLQVGADRVALNTALVEEPEVLPAAAARFGIQCIVACIDYRTGPDGPRVWTRSGTEATGLDVVELARRAADAGAGEIVLTCIDRDGTMEGYDLVTLRAVTDAVHVPVIASGGAGEYRHLAEAVTEGGASAVAAASMFHFTQQTPLEAKQHLRRCGVPVRLGGS